MQHDTQIIEEHQLVIDTISGEVTAEELREKFKELFSNPKYDESMCGLCDLRNAVSRINRLEFKHLADEIDAATDFGLTRWAILVEDAGF